MTDSPSLRDKVLAWLEKQGYPLEMRVAALLREKTKFSIRQGWHYTDLESTQSREIDVVATAGELYGFAAVHFLIECKAPGSPWVLFTSEHTMENFNRLTAFGAISRDGKGPLTEELMSLKDEFTPRVKALPWFWHQEPVGYSLVQALGGNSETPYAAAISATKAALYCHASSPEHNTPPRFMVTFPVVVTSAPLFECFLEANGKPTLREIERGFWFFQQRIGSTPPIKVAIVSEAGLGLYIEECTRVSETVMDIFKPTVEQAWEARKRKIPPTDPGSRE
jgi:hypothetical protein